MNGKSGGSGVLALLTNCEIPGHSINFPEARFPYLSNEDNYPVCVFSDCCKDQMEMSECDL